jgi:hypothetical protein
MKKKYERSSTNSFTKKDVVGYVPKALQIISLAGKYKANYYLIKNKTSFSKILILFVNENTRNKFFNHLVSKYVTLKNVIDSKQYYSKDFTSYLFSIELPLLEKKLSKKLNTNILTEITN